MGDAAVLANCVNTMISSNYTISIVCRKGLGDFWKCFFPEINYIEYDMSGGLDEEFCSANFSSEYEAVFSVSLNPTAAFIASFPTTTVRVGMIETTMYYMGSKGIFDKIADVAKNEHIISRYDKLFSTAIEGFKTKFDYSFPSSVSQNKKKIIIHPGAKWKPRRWPAEYYVDLLNRLDREGIAAEVISGPEDTEIREQLMTVTTDNIHHKSLSSIEELIHSIDSADIFIGNDSGPAHIANLLNKRTIVLWGPGNYERIHPVGDNVEILIEDVDCRPCKQYANSETCPNGENICLRKITVDSVLDRISYFRNKK